MNAAMLNKIYRSIASDQIASMTFHLDMGYMIREYEIRGLRLGDVEFFSIWRVGDYGIIRAIKPWQQDNTFNLEFFDSTTVDMGFLTVRFKFQSRPSELVVTRYAPFPMANGATIATPNALKSTPIDELLEI